MHAANELRGQSVYWKRQREDVRLRFKRLFSNVNAANRLGGGALASTLGRRCGPSSAAGPATAHREITAMERCTVSDSSPMLAATVSALSARMRWLRTRALSFSRGSSSNVIRLMPCSNPQLQRCIASCVYVLPGMYPGGLAVATDGDCTRDGASTRQAIRGGERSRERRVCGDARIAERWDEQGRVWGLGCEAPSSCCHCGHCMCMCQVWPRKSIGVAYRFHMDISYTRKHKQAQHHPGTNAKSIVVYNEVPAVPNPTIPR